MNDGVTILRTLQAEKYLIRHKTYIGETKTVSITDIAGGRVIHGGNSLATGPVDKSRLPTIISSLKSKGFSHIPQPPNLPAPAPYLMDRQRYADAYGPTTGDTVRLGDTELYLQVERDMTHYGDECVFGGGKVIREGMGQAVGIAEKDALDLVITNALIVDYTGIYKASSFFDDSLIRSFIVTCMIT